MTDSPKTIYCDCCGDIVMAKARDGKIIVRRKQNRAYHFLVIKADTFQPEPAHGNIRAIE